MLKRGLAGTAAVAAVAALWPSAQSKADDNFCAEPSYGKIVTVSGHIWERDYPRNELIIRVERDGCQAVDIVAFLPGEASKYPTCEPPHNITITGRIDISDDDALYIRRPTGVDCY